MAVATGMDDGSRRKLIGAMLLVVLALGWLGIYFGGGKSGPPALS